MKLWAAVLCISLAWSNAKPAPHYHRDSPTAIPNEFIVVLHKNLTDDQVSSHIADVSALFLEKDGPSPRRFRVGQLVGYFLAAEDKVAGVLGELDEVRYIEQNQVFGLDQQCVNQQEATWGLVRTAIRPLELNGLYPHKEGDGEGVDAYVLDTGIYTEHNDFGGRAEWGTDTHDNPSPETDGHGHGTHVAGTILATTWGLAKKARAIAVKVLSQTGSGTTINIIAGIDWVTQHHNQKSNKKSVANMSLGGSTSTAMNEAVQNSVAAGVVYSVSAGNDRFSACNKSPASTKEAITVACSDNQDQLCSFSNFGECVDVIAPGQDITSCWKDGPFSDNTISGTSMSAPHVAGVAAKLLSEKEMTPAEVKDAILSLASTDMIKPQLPAGTPNLLLYHSCPESNYLQNRA